MTGAKAIEVHKKLLACVRRQNTPKCDRQCMKCDLLLSKPEVDQALTTALNCMKYIQDHRRAKNETN